MYFNQSVSEGISESISMKDFKPVAQKNIFFLEIFFIIHSIFIFHRSSKREGSRGWDEITGIKPASHQLTRHSSSCSLASGPSSPTHQINSSSHSLQPPSSSAGNRPSSNHSSLPRSSTNPSAKVSLFASVVVPCMS